MINITKLSEDLKTAGLPLESVSLKPDPKWSPSKDFNKYNHAEAEIGIVWASKPTADQLNSAESLVLGHDGAPSLDDKAVNSLKDIHAVIDPAVIVALAAIVKADAGLPIPDWARDSIAAAAAKITSDRG